MSRAPGRTPRQRKHEREQRALMRLRRAAVRYSVVTDDDQGDNTVVAFAFADLTAACDKYASALNARERRRMSTRSK